MELLKDGSVRVKHMMLRNSAPHLLRILIAGVLLLSPLASVAQTAPDRIVNAYFASDAVRVDGWLQPERVLRQLKGNHPATAAVFVLNVYLNKGNHNLLADVIGPDGKRFTQIPFATETVEQDADVRAIWGVLKGRLPTGGITVQVNHSRDGGSAEILGTFFIPTVP